MSRAKAQIFFLLHSFYFDCRLDCRDSSHTITKNHKKLLTIGSGFNHKQCQLHGIKKIEPSISAVLRRVGALRRLGGIPCSLGRPPARLMWVCCVHGRTGRLLLVVILYLVLVSCRLLS